MSRLMRMSFLALFSLAFLHPVAMAVVSVTVSPGVAQVNPGQQQQFTANVSGAFLSAVIWSIDATNCTGISCGQIADGLYTAPPTAPSPAFVTVRATSFADPSKSGTARVNIGTAAGVISVAVSPDGVSLNAGGKKQFTAAVQGTSNTAVTWGVTGFGCVGVECGTITSGGLYTAPATPPSPSFVTVTATSVADPTKRGSATVTIGSVVAVSISPLSAEVITGGRQQFRATVTGAPDTGARFTVSGAGCTGAGCGTITQSGLYTAPLAIPNPAKVTVKATANADGTTSATAVVTIVVPIVVTVSPKAVVDSVNEQEQFRATVQGTTNHAVKWSVSGAGCSGAACGTVSSTGLYTAPASVPRPPNVVVTATSVANSTRSASAVVTIAPSLNAKLKGPYAFQFSGFDANGIYQSVGSFTADGQGKLTGLEDINNTAKPSTAVRFTGTYQVNNDNRGLMTFTTASGAPHAFRFALDQVGAKARFIEFDSSGVRGSGIIERQDPTAFTPSAFTGGYAFSLAGMGSSGLRIGALGLIFPDGANFISGVSMDVNDGGLMSPTFPSFTGSYTVAPSGRGTLTLTIPGFAGGVLHFAFYVVSASEFLLQSVDPPSSNNPIFGGPAELQTGTPFPFFLSSSFNGRSIFNLSGAANGSIVDDRVGEMLFDGSGAVIVHFDENQGGLITIAGRLSGLYSVEVTGRADLELVDVETHFPTRWIMYAIGPNRAFLMDSSSSVAVGDLKGQEGVVPASNSSIVGTYLFGPGAPTVSGAPLFSGVSNFDGGADLFGQGVLTGREDISNSGGNTANVFLGGKYGVSVFSKNGRGNLLLTSPSHDTISVWVVSSREVIGLDVDSSATQPTILHYQQ
jgi:hypothetical protein